VLLLADTVEDVDADDEVVVELDDAYVASDPRACPLPMGATWAREGDVERTSTRDSELGRVSFSSLVEEEEAEDDDEEEEEVEDVDGPDIVPRPSVVPVNEVTAGATVTALSGTSDDPFFSNSKNFS